jgi:hypothetical protein
VREPGLRAGNKRIEGEGGCGIDFFEAADDGGQAIQDGWSRMVVWCGWVYVDAMRSAGRIEKKQRLQDRLSAE